MKLVKKPATSLNKEKTKELFAWIDAGILKDEEFTRKANKWREKLTGKRLDKKWDSEEEKVVMVNLAYSHISTLLPSIFLKDPYVECEADIPQHEADVPTWEAVINSTLPRIKYKKTARKVIMDAAVLGEGWAKHGWVVNDPSEGEEEKSPTTQHQNIGLIMEGYEEVNGQARKFGENGTALSRALGHSTGEITNPASWMHNGAPFADRIRPTDVVVDPLVADRDPDNARFVAIRYIRPLDELRANPDYTIPAKLPDNAWFAPRGLGHMFYFSESSTIPYRNQLDTLKLPEHAKLAEIFEVWVYQLVDLNLYKQVVTLMRGVDEPIRMSTWQQVIGKDISGFPVSRITFNDVPDDIPMSELESWAPIADAINWLTTKSLGNVKRFSRMYEVDTNKLKSQKELTKLKRGADGTAILVVDSDGTPVVKPINFPTGQSDHWNTLAFLDEKVERISGQSENRQGQTSARTATEASIVEGGQQSKQDDKFSIIEDFLVDSISKIIALIKNFVDTDYVTKLTGAAGSVQWMKFGPHNIKWMPDIRIRPNSTRSSNEQKEMQKWSTVLQTSVQMLQIGLPVRIDIIYMHFLKALKVDNVQEIMGMIGTNPEAEQLMEILQMLAGIPIEPSPMDPDEIHIATIQKFLNTPAAMQMQTVNPQGLQLVIMHMEMHTQMLEQKKSGAAQQQSESSKDPYASEEPTSVQSPANEARGQRPQGPESATPVKGSGNQLRV